jgi:hypothetical protein
MKSLGSSPSVDNLMTLLVSYTNNYIVFFIIIIFIYKNLTNLIFISINFSILKILSIYFFHIHFLILLLLLLLIIIYK